MLLSIIAIQDYFVLLLCPIDPFTIRSLIAEVYPVLFRSVFVRTLNISVDESTFFLPSL